MSKSNVDVTVVPVSSVNYAVEFTFIIKVKRVPDCSSNNVFVSFDVYPEDHVGSLCLVDRICLIETIS